jgi:ketosteroid isomerase-like protein
MRNWILCICIGLATPCSAFGQQPAATDKTPASAPTPSSPSKDTGAQAKLAETLEAKVKAAWAAFKKKDKDAYAAFLTYDFQAVEADGDGERSKAKTVREVEHSMFVEYSLQLFQVQELGPHYAFVTYECTMRFPRGSATLFRRVFIGELWTNRDGDWKMMRYQETVVR